MFQSISAFLPSNLQLGSGIDKSSSPGHKIDVLKAEPEQQTRSVDDDGMKKKRKERTNESFIVVRPPPSKSNHPLNLQVQLVPPSNKDRPNDRQSLDSTAEAEFGQASLSRTSSNRSDTSLYSSYSSTGSLSTLGTTSTASSGRRMIIPLYNLQAHNVMQNVILDAGTDAKVAKFLKRGLELIGLALLEPVEVWGSGSGSNDESLGRGRGSVDYRRGLSPGSAAYSPTSSSVSLVTSQTHEPTLTTSATPTPTATPTQSSTSRSGRKFFGKLFRNKKDASAPETPASPTPTVQVSPLSSIDSTRSKRASLLVAPGHGPGLASSAEPTLQPPILGIQATLRSPTIPPQGRPVKYVWVVRRWLKGEPESMLSGVRDKLHEVRSGGAGSSVGLEAKVEVRFEWARGTSSKKQGRDERQPRDRTNGSRRRRGGEPSSAMPSNALQQQQLHPPQSPSAFSHKQQQQQQQRQMSPARRPRRSAESTRSISPGGAGSIMTNESNDARIQTHSTDSYHDADGDESEPEDSETPWTCTLVMRPLSPSSAHLTPTPQHPSTSSAPQGQPSTVRVKVAAVVPTPHHPKVVALLKVPFPLPDVEVDHVTVRKRIVTPAGIVRPTLQPMPASPTTPQQSSAAGSGASVKKYLNGEDGAGKENGGAVLREERGRSSETVLTAEEIKDIVSCTALWLVVREGFGGVGRERRKGDGWRLRG